VAFGGDWPPNQAHLFSVRKLSGNSVAQRTVALRFLFVKTLKRTDMLEHIPFPKVPLHLPTVLSPEEVTRLIDSAPNLLYRTMVRLAAQATGFGPYAIRVSAQCRSWPIAYLRRSRTFFRARRAAAKCPSVSFADTGRYSALAEHQAKPRCFSHSPASAAPPAPFKRAYRKCRLRPSRSLAHSCRRHFR
jgi:hypothetical protein